MDIIYRNAHKKRLKNKKKKAALREHEFPCHYCGIKISPQWRFGPLGKGTLCNACGLRFATGKLLIADFKNLPKGIEDNWKDWCEEKRIEHKTKSIKENKRQKLSQEFSDEDEKNILNSFLYDSDVSSNSDLSCISEDDSLQTELDPKIEIIELHERKQNLELVRTLIELCVRRERVKQAITRLNFELLDTKLKEPSHNNEKSEGYIHTTLPIDFFSTPGYMEYGNLFENDSVLFESHRGLEENSPLVFLVNGTKIKKTTTTTQVMPCLTHEQLSEQNKRLLHENDSLKRQIEETIIRVNSKQYTTTNNDNHVLFNTANINNGINYNNFTNSYYTFTNYETFTNSNNISKPREDIPVCTQHYFL